MSIEAGVLYIVATPIGNLDDITLRACKVLAAVSVVLAEDTRHTASLFNHYQIKTTLLPLHEHNERDSVAAVLSRLRQGESVALVSDAGTPLVSDPGYHLVRETVRAGIKVSPVPGPSAVIAALSVSGLSSDRFLFEGFLPAKPAARRRHLETLRDEHRTMIFFEAPHRVMACVEDMIAIFSAERDAALTRELTKLYETVISGSLGQIMGYLQASDYHRKGEIALLLAGAPARTACDAAQTKNILRVLSGYFSPSQAAAVTAEITGAKKSELYRLAMELRSS